MFIAHLNSIVLFIKKKKFNCTHFEVLARIKGLVNRILKLNAWTYASLPNYVKIHFICFLYHYLVILIVIVIFVEF